MNLCVPPQTTLPHASLAAPVQVTFKRKRHYLGMHVSEEAAARAYDQGAICLLVRQSEAWRWWRWWWRWGWWWWWCNERGLVVVVVVVQGLGLGLVGRERQVGRMLP